MSTLQPSEQQRSTQERLIEAAADEFAQHGYRGAGVRAICGAAGANQAAVNYHFGSKLGLYKAVLTHLFDHATDRRMPALADEPGDPEGQLRNWIGWEMERVLGKRSDRLSQLILREIRNQTPAFDELLERSIRPVHAELAAIVSAVIGEDDPTSEFVQMCCMSVLGQCIFYTTARPMIERMNLITYDAQSVQRLSEHIADFCVAGLRAVRKRNP